MTTMFNQTVLVTGANRGLGREFVKQSLTRGVAKVYAAARNPESVTSDDPRVVPLRLDVSDPDAVARAAQAAHDVTIVINHAGIAGLLQKAIADKLTRTRCAVSETLPDLTARAVRPW